MKQHIIALITILATPSISLAAAPVQVSEPSMLGLFAISAAALFLVKRKKN